MNRAEERERFLPPGGPARPDSESIRVFWNAGGKGNSPSGIERTLYPSRYRKAPMSNVRPVTSQSPSPISSGRAAAGETLGDGAQVGEESSGQVAEAAQEKVFRAQKPAASSASA